MKRTIQFTAEKEVADFYTWFASIKRIKNASVLADYSIGAFIKKNPPSAAQFAEYIKLGGVIPAAFLPLTAEAKTPQKPTDHGGENT